MAWNDVLIPMVRNLSADVSDTPTYEDERIEQAIITAGLIVTREFEFKTNYVFDFSTPDIIPDPTEPTSLDNGFIALVALKAACILSMNAYQHAVGRGIRVRDDDSEIDTTSGFRGYQDIIKLGPCASYNKLLDTLSRRQGMNNGKAVLGPYSISGPNYTTHFGNLRIVDFYNSWGLW